jgi:hypothetical protein
VFRSHPSQSGVLLRCKQPTLTESVPRSIARYISLYASLTRSNNTQRASAFNPTVKDDRYRFPIPPQKGDKAYNNRRVWVFQPPILRSFSQQRLPCQLLLLLYFIGSSVVTLQSSLVGSSFEIRYCFVISSEVTIDASASVKGIGRSW